MIKWDGKFIFINYIRKAPSISINPLHENEKSFDNSRNISPRRDYSPKNYKSPIKNNSPKSFYNDSKEKTKSPKNNNNSFLEKVLSMRQMHFDAEKKRDEEELKQKSKKFKYRIEKDYNSFLTNMYENSLKFYNMTLNAKLSIRKYEGFNKKK